MSDIGEKIRSVLREKDITNEKFATLLNVSRQRVHAISKSKDLKWSTVVKICDGLGITVEDLCKY